jgi:hypothetical protein
LRAVDWDAVAGIAAAVIALVLHLLHVVSEDVLLSIILVILALVLIRDLRRESRDEELLDLGRASAGDVRRLAASLAPPDVLLVGPSRLRAESERFARAARGDMTWFNVCLLMFEPDSLFDTLLRPAVENPHVTCIEFILDEGERGRWETAVVPKLLRCAGHEKVRTPRWCSLHESVSFILSEGASPGAVEAHVSFWGEPFMSRAPGRDIPRYIFHVQAHSELIGRLVELARQYRRG